MRMFGEDVADFSELEKLDNPELKGKGWSFQSNLWLPKRFLKKDKYYNSPLS
jgi:2-oxoisovalerate dehydrogenase E1 component